MNKPGILMISILLLFNYISSAQTISGIVNSYAAVTTISGTGISVLSATAAAAFMPGDRILLIQMKGASVDQNNTSSFGDITSLGGAGTFEFLTVLSVAGNVITTASTLTHTYNSASGFVQLVRVPKFCTPTVSSSLTCAAWNGTTGTGGVLAFEAGTLTLNSGIDASEKGFRGGNFTAGSFGCNNGNYADAAGIYGGQKGESISAYITNLNGLKGKQANGGGASNSGNSGGGGGGNGGSGGFGGNQYSDCDTMYDERGVGGLSLSAGLSTLFMGGGGGGGFKDNGMVATVGGNGGGIIYIKANAIVSNNGSIMASGGNVTILSDAEGAGGGGAGGTIFIECNTITGNLSVKADGGFGGSNNNSAFVSFCHGTGGGGGGGVFAFSSSTLAPNISYSSLGGAAGTVNNPASPCYSTTNGADPGTNGVSLPALPASALVLTAPPTLTVTPATAICKGESVSMEAGGGDNYSWSNGTTNSVIVVSPNVTSFYTVTATNTDTNSCQASASTTVSVSNCTGINVNADDGGLKIYPNPTSGKLFIETKMQLRISICDETGRELLERSLQKGDHSLDISNYMPGVYFIKVIDGENTRVMKLIKTN